MRKWVKWSFLGKEVLFFVENDITKGNYKILDCIDDNEKYNINGTCSKCNCTDIEELNAMMLSDELFNWE